MPVSTSNTLLRNARILISFLALLCLGLSAVGETTASGKESQAASSVEPLRNVELAEAKAWIEEHRGKEGYAVLDLRTLAEVAQGHIEGAEHLDFLADGFDQRLQELDRDRHYLIHCASGGRSGKALERMRELGFRNVLHMDAGFRGWLAAEYPQVTE